MADRMAAEKCCDLRTKVGREKVTQPTLFGTVDAIDWFVTVK